MNGPSARYRRLLSVLTTSGQVSKREAYTLALHVSDIADACAGVAKAVEKWTRSAKQTDIDTLWIDLLINLVHLKTHWAELGPMIEKRIGVTEEEVSPAAQIPRRNSRRRQKR